METPLETPLVICFKKEIRMKKILTTAVLGMLMASPAAFANTSKSEVSAFTKDVPNAFSIPYNEQWVNQGCSREAWTQLSQSYNAKMTQYKAQAQVLDQRMLDTVRSPSQLSLDSFKNLGCDLSSSLGVISDMAETVTGLLGAISSGNIKDQITQQLESKARELVRGVARQAAEKACSIATKTIEQRMGALKDLNNDANNFINMVENYDKTVERNINNAINNATQK